jgi:phosphate transport system substrate-binding protein
MTLRKILAAVLFFSMILCTSNADAAISDKDFISLCLGGSVKDVEEALKSGANANANAKNRRISTALVAAILTASYSRNPEVISLLLKNGADVNAEDFTGNTAWTFAAEFCHDPEVMSLLLEAGADVNAKSNDDWTHEGKMALMFVAESHSSPEVLSFLLKNGANVNAKTGRGNTALMFAARKGSPEVVSLLLKNGADVNAKNNGGNTALTFAANPEVVSLLLESGADVNAKGNDGMTALIMAAFNDNSEVVSLLLENGADTNTDVDNLLWQRYGGPTIADDIYLAAFMPGNPNNRLARLDEPSSLHIFEEFPVIDGATAFFPIYTAAANETYQVEKAELQRYVTCSRTPEAYNKLVSGKADVIFVLQPSDGQMKQAFYAGVEINLTPIAREAFVFFVNERNPVSALSTKQIQDIYLNKITNWRSVGGPDKKILPFQRPEDSGSQTTMIKEVMKGKGMPAPLEVFRIAAMGAIVRAVATYRDYAESIGYSFRFFTQEMVTFDNERIMGDPPKPAEGRVKLIDVDGIAPTEENIRSGAYPFTVDICAATRRHREHPNVAALIAWLLSPQGQSLVEKTGYVGVM